MDGVLIDARDFHYQALNQALSPFGLDIDRDAHLATFDGLPTRTKLEMLSNCAGLAAWPCMVSVNQMKQKYTVDMVGASFVTRCSSTNTRSPSYQGRALLRLDGH